jgi:hypothetical protein
VPRDNPVYHVGDKQGRDLKKSEQTLRISHPRTLDARLRAGAGYDRTEINRVLDIRYQHVRNVLLKSGITGGLSRGAEREPIEVDAAPAPRQDTSWTMLTEAGFQFIGEWTQDPESQIKLDANAPPCLPSPSARTGVSLIFDFPHIRRLK